MNKKESRIINLILSVLPLLILMTFIGIKFDYYYDLNDDVLMKDILSGAYTGAPEGHNIQMLWPISFVISLFYKIAPGIPWYGMFLCFMQFGAIGIIVYRTVSVFENLGLKIMTAASEISLFGALMLLHLVNTQYTITVAMMASAALVWFVTSDKKDNAGDLIKSNIPAILIAVVAYLLRSEMLLLMLPFICAAGVLKWSFEDKIFEKKNIAGYMGVFASIVAGLILGQLLHAMAYAPKDWQTFTDLFNGRTELYDYQVIPPYEGNEAFYEEIGISKEEQLLFENYNFGINTEIDNVTMWQVADYAGKLNVQKRPFFEKLSGMLRIYVYRISHGPGSVGSDYPWNVVTLVLFLSAFIGYVLIKRYRGFLDLAFLFFIRTALWLYILMGERSPDRITHSLYFIEICVLIANLIMIYRENKEAKKSLYIPMVSYVLLFILAGIIWPEQLNNETVDMNNRKATNASYIALYDYMEKEADSRFFIDVYSSVSYSEEIYGDMKTVSKINSDIMGGWACFSPLQNKKYKKLGITDIESGLLSENSFFVKKAENSMEWLLAYYESHGIETTITKRGDIDGVFEIYEIRRK